MTLEDFLSPVSHSLIENEGKQWHSQSIAAQLKIHQEVDGIPELEEVKIALIGVIEDRGNQANNGCRDSADFVRKYLYPLFTGKWEVSMADLGNIYPGEKLSDTYFAIREVCGQLLQKGITPVLMGGSHDLTYAQYRAYDHLEQSVNMVCVDSRFDLGEENDELSARSFFSHVVMQKPYLLFNYSNLGYQTYFVNQEEIDLMERMFFDVQRLGLFKNNIKEAEPHLRDADLVSVDMNAIRLADAPGQREGSPNGFDGEQACAIARYAGISDKVTSFGIYENNPLFDHQGQSSHLVAQMLWYFIEGFNARKGDYPFASKSDYQKFTVLIDEGEHELIFYKSHLSARWWIEVPIPSESPQHQRHKLVPCSYEDYLKATENEIPLRWWNAMKKSI